MKHDPTLSQWWTPRSHAALTGRLFGDRLFGKRVLEPSAGRGVFVDVALEQGAAFVVAVEVDARLFRELQAKYAGNARVQVVRGDFPTSAPELVRSLGRFDVVIGNPPYDAGADTEHLAEWNRALAPDGVGIGLLRLHAMATREKWIGVWGSSTITDLVLYVRRPSFSGTAKTARGLEFATFAWRHATADELATRPPLDAPMFSSKRDPNLVTAILAEMRPRVLFAY